MAQEFRSLRATAQSIGFHELRQALEISSLKQDLERVARDTDDLRAHIEDAVEQVRAQFAALSPTELADAARMAPLLQSAVKTLLSIRDAARRIEVNAGPVADADRPDPPPPSLLHAAPAPLPEPPPAANVAPAPSPPPSPPPMQAVAPPPPPPLAPVVASIGPMSWMTSAGAPPPRSAAPRPTRAASSGSSVDWLGPPRR
ncbi:hypothetical protein [Azospirillum sp. TSO22-1]|uniref:hypothetical protein n=1 Tax=Azospirillum sp. TSO22-1 TaxID=716789 RepID=UPI000D61EE2D|nr:hypothetical protein [Azospirillum sp. TSO22-1]PWC55492.1 hypothetical protein TSO221_04195 [Azospirillum sp. TSO22-1]